MYDLRLNALSLPLPLSLSVSPSLFLSLPHHSHEHDSSIERTRTLHPAFVQTPASLSTTGRLPSSSIEDVRQSFRTIVAPGRMKVYVGDASERSADQGEEEDGRMGAGDVFVPYVSADDASERGCVG